MGKEVPEKFFRYEVCRFEHGVQWLKRGKGENSDDCLFEDMVSYTWMAGSISRKEIGHTGVLTYKPASVHFSHVYPCIHGSHPFRSMDCLLNTSMIHRP